MKSGHAFWAFVVLVLVALSGCGSKDGSPAVASTKSVANRFVGEWRTDAQVDGRLMTITFDKTSLVVSAKSASGRGEETEVPYTLNAAGDQASFKKTVNGKDHDFTATLKEDGRLIMKRTDRSDVVTLKRAEKSAGK
jgi:hypothetical protein